MKLPRSALVVGLARSGQAAALALARRRVQVIGIDRAADVDASRLERTGVEVRLGSEEESLVDSVDVVVKSPGVPREAPPVAAARARGIPVWGEVEVAVRVLPNPLLGVTGTNGKTTTTELLGVMLGAPTAGNVGRALCELDGEVEAEDWIVCELSSFQLEDAHTLRPRVGVLLNLEPDHLDRHGSYEDYAAAKLRLFRHQRPDDTAVVPRAFRDVPGDAERIEFSADDLLPAEPLIPGRHNRENAAAATAAARAAGATEAAIESALRTFRGVPHRLELVRERGGVRFVNDSKATNTAAARRAVEAYGAPLRLILGGRGKGERFDELARVLRRRGTAYLIGETAGEIADALAREEVPFERCGDLARAVTRAADDSRPGEVVLLAPACASYDQFRDFEERGDRFRELVEALP